MLRGERNVRTDIAACLGAMVLAFLLAAIALRLWNADLHVPFNYGGDANLNQIAIKGMLDNGWFQHNPDLAAPFGQSLLDFPVYSGETLQFVIMKAIGVFTSDSAAVMNVFFLLGFPLAALTAFAALRLLGIGRLAAATVAVLYAIGPYHFLRGEFHLFIGAYYAVPLGVFLALTVLLGRPMPRTVWVVVFCLVIGSAHVYYAVFTLLLLVAALLLRLIANGRERGQLMGLLCVGLIGVVVLANHLPNILYAHEHGSNPAILRLPGESERFGLKLTELVLPVPGHRLEPLADLRDHYKPPLDPVNEGGTQALGLLASLGLIWLFVVLLLGTTARISRLTDDLQVAAARLAAVAFVAGTVGGLSALVTYFLTDQVRAWGRISIVIAFLALVPLAVFIDRGLRVWQLRSAVLVAAGLLLVGFLDQTNGSTVPQYTATQAAYRSDRAAVRAVESTLPKSAMVFELPFEPFPEPQPWFVPPALGPYGMGRPYLHSRDLHWSYGAMKGRADAWQRAVSDVPPSILAREVAAGGFASLLVDRGGYVDDGDRVISELAAETRAKPKATPGSSLVTFDLRAYAQRLLAGQSAASRAQLRHDIYEPVRTGYGRAFSQPRQSDDHVLRYVSGPATLRLTNTDSRVRHVRVGFTLAAPPQQRVQVRLAAPGRKPQTVSVGGNERRVTFPLAVPPGTSRVRIDATGGTQSLIPDVARPYDLILQDPLVVDEAVVPLGPPPASQLSSNAGSPFIDSL
jgi:hypothetical protein